MTTLDARALIADFGGPHAFAVAWLTGQVADELRDEFRAAADTLGLRAWLDEIDAPTTAQTYRLLVEAAACLTDQGDDSPHADSQFRAMQRAIASVSDGSLAARLALIDFPELRTQRLSYREYEERRPVDPSESTVVSSLTVLTAEGLNRLGQRPHRWPDLEAQLKRFPILRELLTWLGRDESSESDWLNRLGERVRAGFSGGFRDLLRETLGDAASWPDDTQWRRLVERAVLRESLTQSRISEPEWMVWFRETALADHDLDIGRLAELELPSERFTRPGGFAEFKGSLLARAETQVHEMLLAWT